MKHEKCEVELLDRCDYGWCASLLSINFQLLAEMRPAMIIIHQTVGTKDGYSLVQYAHMGSMHHEISSNNSLD
jgi:hypothetical protein